MCGIFGFITKNGRGPDVSRLRRIAAVTESRGQHAFGLAWLAADEKLHAFKRPGPATAALNDLEQCRGAAMVIGHCRFATHGAPSDNRNNHPHPAGRGWLVHNGVVRNHVALAHEYGLVPRTQCDSEVLGLLLARIPGPIEWRAARTAQLAGGPLALLGVWAKPARMLVVRQGNPLWYGQTRDGAYFGSLPDELPGQPQPVPDACVCVLAHPVEPGRQRLVALGP